MSARAVKLRDFLRSVRHRPFRPGKFECGLFAADWVKALHGFDPAVRWRGQYRTIDGGLELLRRDGFNDQVEVVAGLFDEMPGWHAAAPGDIASVLENGHLALGIVGGPIVHVLHPARGLDAVDLQRAARVFRP